MADTTDLAGTGLEVTPETLLTKYVAAAEGMCEAGEQWLLSLGPTATFGDAVADLPRTLHPIGWAVGCQRFGGVTYAIQAKRMLARIILDASTPERPEVAIMALKAGVLLPEDEEAVLQKLAPAQGRGVKLAMEWRSGQHRRD